MMNPKQDSVNRIPPLVEYLHSELQRHSRQTAVQSNFMFKFNGSVALVPNTGAKKKQVIKLNYVMSHDVPGVIGVVD